MWHWDSCFHAIAWRALRPRARARRAAHRAALGRGRTASCRTRSSGTAPAGWRRAPLYATRGLRGDRRTETIGPPLLAFAWEIVADASRDDDPGFRTRGAAPRSATHLRLARARARPRRRRAADDHRCPTSRASTTRRSTSPVFGRLTHDRPGYALLVERGRRARLGLARASSRATTTTSRTSGQRRLRAVAARDGAPERRRRVDARGRARVEHGAARALLGRAHAACSSTSPAATSGRCASRRGRRCRRSRCAGLPERRAPAPRRGAPARRRAATARRVGIPSVSMEEPSFNPRWDRFRCWRGPSWVNTAWLLVPGAARARLRRRRRPRRRRRSPTAARATACASTTTRCTGRGLGARGFGWSTLLLDLLAGRRRASTTSTRVDEHRDDRRRAQHQPGGDRRAERRPAERHERRARRRAGPDRQQAEGAHRDEHRADVGDAVRQPADRQHEPDASDRQPDDAPRSAPRAPAGAGGRRAPPARAGSAAARARRAPSARRPARAARSRARPRRHPPRAAAGATPTASTSAVAHSSSARIGTSATQIWPGRRAPSLPRSAAAARRAPPVPRGSATSRRETRPRWRDARCDAAAARRRREASAATPPSAARASTRCRPTTEAIAQIGASANARPTSPAWTAHSAPTAASTASAMSVAPRRLTRQVIPAQTVFGVKNLVAGRIAVTRSPHPLTARGDHTRATSSPFAVPTVAA